MTMRTVAALAASALLATVPSAHAAPQSPLFVLVDTAAQRLQTADPVAAFKWIDGDPITDAPRAQQVLDSVAAAATAHGRDAGYVQGIFRDQIGATEGIEYTRFGQWKLMPDTAPTAAPDLAQTRSAIDAYNTAMVDEIALQWDALHAPSCGADLAGAVDTVVADRELDPLYRQALQSATRSYCETT
jgi:chorismate mutase